MNVLDIIILIILSVFAIRSFFNGFIKEAFGLGGLILGVITANTFYISVASIINHYINSMLIANILAFIIIVIIVTMLTALIGREFIKAIGATKLKWADKFFGIAFGLAKGVIIASLLIMFFVAVLPDDISIITDSKLLPKIQLIYRSFLDLGY